VRSRAAAPRALSRLEVISPSPRRSERIGKAELPSGPLAWDRLAAELECRQQDLVDPSLEFRYVRRICIAAHLASGHFELIPGVTLPLLEQRVVRVDDHLAHPIFQHHLTADGGFQWTDDDHRNPAVAAILARRRLCRPWSPVGRPPPRIGSW
jgi:hypothetical protein